MAEIFRTNLPTVELRRLDFLLGDGEGLQTLYPPDSDPAYYKAFVSGSMETCDRFLRVDYFADIASYGTETFRSLFTYSDSLECFRCWSFCTASEEPAHFCGRFENGSLVMVSDPYQMPWGLQRLRHSFTPLASGGYFFLCERWELDGWIKHCSVTFLPPN
jgi:hypothetical protein